MTRGPFHEKHKNQLWYLTLRQFLRHKMAVFGMLMMAVIVFSVVFVDRISPYDPETPDLSNMLSPPSLAHPLGTDELGRDMLTRTLYGGRVSLIVGVFAMLVAVTLGTWSAPWPATSGARWTTCSCASPTLPWPFPGSSF